MGRAALVMTARRFFLYGTLCHGPLREAVIGRPVAVTAARLDGHAVHWAQGHDFPVIVPRAGAAAPGLLTEPLGPAEAARLDFYEGGFVYDRTTCLVAPGWDPARGERPAGVGGADPGGPVAAEVYLPAAGGRIVPGAAWDLAAWETRLGAVITDAARLLMAGFVDTDADCDAARAAYPSCLADAVARAQARADPAPATMRHDPAAGPCAATADGDGAGDFVVEAARDRHRGFYALGAYRLRHRRFDGVLSAPMGREVFRPGDVVTVLPYDPRRDLVALIEQFRPGPVARGDRRPWLLEPVAGRLDPGETCEEAALREAREEAGLDLGRLWTVGRYYSSPGGSAEFVTSFIGAASLDQNLSGRIGGKEEEGEDIRLHVLPFARAEALIASGEINAGPLLLSLLWLAPRRAGLRAAG